MTQDDRTTVYTDGACAGNPGPGGWAWAVPGGRFAAGCENPSTNQRMELAAVLDAVRTLPGPLQVVSDSTYVVNCFRDRWWEGWLARGWTNKAKKPVANRDLWEPLVDEYRADPARLRFRWVKGHGSDPFNDLVDRLAVEAAATQCHRSGDEPPDVVGPADTPGRAARARVPAATASAAATDAAGHVPEGRRLAITGLRPPEMGGYGETEVAAGIRARLAEILAAKRTLHPDLVVLTGLGLGAEQLGAEAALAASVPFVGVLPYPDPDSVWPAASRERFRDLIAAAAEIVTVQARPPAGKPQAGAALSRRDAWIARHAHEAIVVWDGRDPMVGRALRSLQDHLGDEDVWIVEPATRLL